MIPAIPDPTKVVEDLRPKVLVVDDESGFTKLLKLAIRKYQFREVNDSSQTLAVARTFQPDVILLDVIMPGADGGDVAALIAQDPTLRHIPILFVTAIVSGGGQTHSMLGDFEFIPKPVDPEKLIAKVDELLARRSAPPIADEA